MELEFIQWLTENLPADHRLTIGPGDDAAVLGEFDGQLVVTSDLLADGTHFDSNEHDLALIGRKALAVNLSDLAAMAAKPLAATISLLLPQTDNTLETAKTIYKGLLPLAEEFEIAIAGGDTNTWQGKLVVSVTAFGVCQANPLRRDGAQAGDIILVTGDLGGSILGDHFTFQPRVHEAIQLAEKYDIHAACDISDGLLLDLSRIIAASDCGAEVTMGAIPISKAAIELGKSSNQPAVDHALSDGEDFELLLVASEEDATRIVNDESIGVPVRAIGRILAELGLFGVHADGKRHPLAVKGYEH